MRGGDSKGIRAYNERLVISAFLQSGPLSKAELARATGLSASAAMVIVNRLIDQGLLVKQAPVRGQVGQPSTPVSVNPEGAYSIGVSIGRRGVQSMLIDFAGGTVARREMPYAFPEPDQTAAMCVTLCTDLLAALDPDAWVLGLGIAIPDDIHAWTEELGARAGALDGWRDLDIAECLASATGLETTLLNDASAACAAEMMAGESIVHRSALYLYFGTFIGGGIVIGGQLYQGANRNAGAIGSMPSGTHRGDPKRNQLIHRASLLQLEELLSAVGIDSAEALAGRAGEPADEIFARWMDAAAPEVARAIVSALSVIDFEVVVIDGHLTPQWRCKLKSRIGEELGALNLSGLVRPTLATGSIGPTAPVLGAAMMPLHARFSPDPGLAVRLK